MSDWLPWANELLLQTAYALVIGLRPTYDATVHLAILTVMQIAVYSGRQIATSTPAY